MGKRRRQASRPVRLISQGRQPVSTWCELLWRGTAQQLLDANCRPQVSRQPRLSLIRVKAESSEQWSEKAPMQTCVSPTARKQLRDPTLPVRVHTSKTIFWGGFCRASGPFVCMTWTCPEIANLWVMVARGKSFDNATFIPSASPVLSNIHTFVGAHLFVVKLETTFSDYLKVCFYGLSLHCQLRAWRTHYRDCLCLCKSIERKTNGVTCCQLSVNNKLKVCLLYVLPRAAYAI